MNSRFNKSYEERKNVCRKCKALCCKMGGTEFTRKEMERVLKAGFPNYFIKINGNHYEAKTKNAACLYLNKSNLCSIESLKPNMCKAWPVFLDYVKHKKKYILIQCPLTPYLSEKQTRKMKKQISKYTEEFIECEDTKLSGSEIKIAMKRYNKFKKHELK